MNEALVKTMEEIQKTVTEFRAANDARWKEYDRRGHVDPLIEEKVDKMATRLVELDKLQQLEAKLVEIEKLAARQQGLGGGADPQKAAALEHRKAFDEFVRKGREGDLAQLQAKAMNITSDPDGGYAVPTELDRMIMDEVLEISPIRQQATVITVSNEEYKKLFNTRGAGSGWVGETDARAETNTPQLAQISPYFGEIYANPAVTQKALDDMFFNVEQFLSDNVGAEFAYQEGDAFVNGNGTSKPKGFLQYTKAATADASRAFGSLQYVATAAAGAWKTASATVSQLDDFVTAIYSLKSPLRNGAAWLMNSLTLAAVMKFKSYGDGAPLWQPSAQAGQPGLLLGYPALQDEGMPDVGVDAYPVALANWKRGYLIADVAGIRVLRDPYTNKPYVHFYSTKRVGGCVVDSEAIKLIKTGAS